jgi:4-carboxymuconolactone decarboxylase
MTTSTTPTGDAQDTHAATWRRGLETRKAVLGAEHVERSMNGVSDFARPMQDLVTEYCWGAIWTRDGIDRKTRSLVNLGMLTALGRNHELGVHVRGAINNGCTPDEIREVLMQTAIYVGVPAALESFRTAEQVLRGMGALDETDGSTNGATARRAG